MKKILLGGLLVVTSALCAPVSVSAYNVQSGDNALLTNIYNAIDEKIAGGSEDQMLELHSMMSYLKVRYSGSEKSLYFLEKMDEYLEERLFRATTASTFVCLPSYVQKGDTVTLGYDLREERGYLVSLATNDVTFEQPIEIAFNAGLEQIMQSIDDEVMGMSLGERKAIYLSPGQAYGTPQKGKVHSFPRQLIEKEARQEVKLGQVFTATFMSATGKMMRQKGTVSAMDAETISLDLNHPLAGRSVGGVIAVKGLFKKCR